MCNKTTGQCLCMGNAMGRRCEQCPDDFIPTEGIFQANCIPCVCSGFSQQCQADNNTFIRAARESPFHNLCQDMPDSCSDGWRLLEDDGTPAAPFGPRCVLQIDYPAIDIMIAILSYMYFFHDIQ